MKPRWHKLAFAWKRELARGFFRPKFGLRGLIPDPTRIQELASNFTISEDTSLTLIIII
jgi:hypothetical protein